MSRGKTYSQVNFTELHTRKSYHFDCPCYWWAYWEVSKSVMLLSSLDIGSGGTKFETFCELPPYLLCILWPWARLSNMNFLQVQYILSWISYLHVSLSGFQLLGIAAHVLLLSEGCIVCLEMFLRFLHQSISSSFCLNVKGLYGPLEPNVAACMQVLLVVFVMIWLCF